MLKHEWSWAGSGSVSRSRTGKSANEIKGSRSVGVTKARVGGRREFSVSSVDCIWKHLAKELLDQDGRLWILGNNTGRRKQGEQQNVSNCWMGKWLYSRENNQKRLYSLVLFLLGMHSMKFRGTIYFCFCALSKYLWHLPAEQLLVCWGANAHCSSISSKIGLCNGYLMSTFSLEFSMFISGFFINWKLCVAILSVLML